MLRLIAVALVLGITVNSTASAKSADNATDAVRLDDRVRITLAAEGLSAGAVRLPERIVGWGSPVADQKLREPEELHETVRTP